MAKFSKKSLKIPMG